MDDPRLHLGLSRGFLSLLPSPKWGRRTRGFRSHLLRVMEGSVREVRISESVALSRFTRSRIPVVGLRAPRGSQGLHYLPRRAELRSFQSSFRPQLRSLPLLDGSWYLPFTHSLRPSFLSFQSYSTFLA